MSVVMESDVKFQLIFDIKKHFYLNFIIANFNMLVFLIF